MKGSASAITGRPETSTSASPGSSSEPAFASTRVTTLRPPSEAGTLTSRVEPADTVPVSSGTWAGNERVATAAVTTGSMLALRVASSQGERTNVPAANAAAMATTHMPTQMAIQRDRERAPGSRAAPSRAWWRVT